MNFNLNWTIETGTVTMSSVTENVTFSEEMARAPRISAVPSEDVNIFISNVTTTGFSVTSESFTNANSITVYYNAIMRN